MSVAAIAGVAAGLAVLGLIPAAARLPSSPVPSPMPIPAPEAALLPRLRAPLTLLCVLAGWVVLGRLPGLAIGAVAGAYAWRVLGRVESPADRRRRALLEQQLPFAVHLLGSCLRSGAAVSTALERVAEAVGGPVAAEFGRVAARLALGADPGTVWDDVATAGSLAPLGRALARAQRSGASVSGAVDRLSGHLRAEADARARARARTVEVRAAVPLGVCLLPAFLLLGVVPLTAGLFSSLRLFG